MKNSKRGEAVEGGVRGDEQDQRGRELHVAVQDAAADAVAGDLGEHGLAARAGAVEMGDEHDAGEHRHQQADHDRQRPAGVARLGRTEDRHGVGDHLDARHRRRPRGEGTEDEQDPDALGGVPGGRRDRVEPVRARLDQPGDDDQRDGEDEQVGGAPNARAPRTPRRLPATSRAITPSPIGTAAEAADGIAEVIAATPEATETATVTM